MVWFFFSPNGNKKYALKTHFNHVTFTYDSMNFSIIKNRIDNYNDLWPITQLSAFKHIYFPSSIDIVSVK